MEAIMEIKDRISKDTFIGIEEISIDAVLDNQQLFDMLNDKANIIYRFVMLYADYVKQTRDYGTGEKISMVEVHTLTNIEENPGITASEVAHMWNRTKGAISQTLSKLEKKGFIERRKRAESGRHIYLYATPKGIALSKAHKEYDIKDLLWINQKMREIFSEKEIEIFYKVLQYYIKLMSANE